MEKNTRNMEMEFKRTSEKVKKFLNSDDSTCTKKEKSKMTVILFTENAEKLKQYIIKQDFAIEVIKEKTVGDKRIKLFLEKV